MKLDAAGSPLWSKVYPISPSGTESTTSNPRDLALATDGNLLIASESAADVTGASVLTNATRNGSILKVNGDNGDVIWSSLIADSNSITYQAVSEGPDGSLYLGGRSSPNVLSEFPSMILTKLNPDGTLLDSALIGTSPGQTLPNGGETVFDEIQDMTWSDGKLWVCGRTGLFNNGSVGGVAEGASAFTAMISPDLDISRFAIHAAPASDDFHTITATEKGLLVAGTSDSFHPWPQGASDEGQSTPGSLLTLMLPWEGKLSFHQASAGHLPSQSTDPKPNRGTYYATPRVLAASQYTSSTNQSLFGGLGQINLTDPGISHPSYNLIDLTINTTAFTLSPTLIEPFEFKALEFVPKSLITDLPTYLEWYQIDPDANGDGDEQDAAAEFFLGTDPKVAEFGVISFDYLIDSITEEPFVRFTLPRSNLAGNAVPTVLSTPDLLNFQTRTDVGVAATPIDSERDTLTLDLAAPEAKEFFQLQFPH